MDLRAVFEVDDHSEIELRDVVEYRKGNAKNRRQYPDVVKAFQETFSGSIQVGVFPHTSHKRQIIKGLKWKHGSGRNRRNDLSQKTASSSRKRRLQDALQNAGSTLVRSAGAVAGQVAIAVAVELVVSAVAKSPSRSSKP